MKIFRKLPFSPGLRIIVTRATISRLPLVESEKRRSYRIPAHSLRTRLQLVRVSAAERRVPSLSRILILFVSRISVLCMRVQSINIRLRARDRRDWWMPRDELSTTFASTNN